MLKHLKTFLLSASACLLTFAALSGVSTRCIIWFYEPDIPEILSRDL